MSEQTTPFRGWIASTGTTSGVRIVVGSWDDGPFGRVDDVMIATPDGRRRLLAPTAALAAEIEERYAFDEVVIGEVRARRGRTWSVTAPGLDLLLVPGRRTWLGEALRLVPPPIRESEGWARVCDPVAAAAMPGVRTHARIADSRLWYAARDHHRLVAVGGTLDGRSLGRIAPLLPPVDFGTASAPAGPCITRVSSHRLRRPSTPAAP